MVLVHGFGGDKDNFTLLARHIPDRYRPVVLDLPGFGESARHPADSYDVRTQAARLREFVDTIGLPRFHLAGNSRHLLRIRGRLLCQAEIPKELIGCRGRSRAAREDIVFELGEPASDLGMSAKRALQTFDD